MDNMVAGNCVFAEARLNLPEILGEFIQVVQLAIHQ